MPDRLGRELVLPEVSVIGFSAKRSGAVQFFLMLFLQSNSQLSDTAEGSLSVGQFIGVEIEQEV